VKFGGEFYKHGEMEETRLIEAWVMTVKIGEVEEASSTKASSPLL